MNSEVTEKSAYLFIDDTHIQDLERVVKSVTPASKVSPKPLIKMDQPWEKEWVQGSYINVIYDAEESLFKMWYGAGRRYSDDWSDEGDGLAYANPSPSSDQSSLYLLPAPYHILNRLSSAS